ncbi:MAG: lipoate--protein ligase family protein [Thermoplasmata archaeon]|nr:lipoate--protein ligase family protein [Thermoplasmata archaeon]
MYLLDLGVRPWKQSMLIFHALARMGVEAVVTVSPDRPFISIGYFQDPSQEVDLAQMEREGLPLFRREVGGGTVYLDRDQIFFHVIWDRGNPAFPKGVRDIYRHLSAPPIEAYGEFGIDTRFREVNDIVTAEGRKIGGLGGANIDGSMVFVGSMMMDFDYGAMARAVRVPDEKFRDKVFKTIEEHVTTMRRELDALPPRGEITRALHRRFGELLGPLIPVALSDDVVAKMAELAAWFDSPEFLYRKVPRMPRGVKIAEGVEILYGLYKARGGLVRTAQEVRGRRIADIGITGDFTMLPKEELSGLEDSLRDVEREGSEVVSAVEGFYESSGIEAPGVTPEDVKKAVMEAK